MDDSELLRQFVGGSQEAFTEFARRYADLVYSAALRQTRDADRAQDVTQAVFVLLARKASHLRPDVILSAWLFKAVRLVAGEQARAERRRLMRERKAAMMRQEASIPDHSVEDADQWGRVTPLLDEGINRLPERYRVPLLLRFFEGRSFAELGTKLGLTEASARQRVHRAIAKLRAFLTRRGISVTDGVLSSGMTSAAVHSAPAAVVAAAAAAPAAAGGAALFLAHAALTASAFFRAKAVAVAAACVTLAAGAVTVVTVELTDRPARPPAARPVAAIVAAAPAPANPPSRQTKRLVIPRPTVVSGPPPTFPMGTVTEVNGKPLAGADVMLVSPRRPLWINQRQWFGGLRITTAADGTFSFPPQDGDWELVACNDSAYVRLTRSALLSSHTLKLQPWARVEGTLWVNNQPKADGEVHLSDGTLIPTWTGRAVLFDTTMKTDARGHFEFTQVVPGEVWLDREFPEKRGTHANFVWGMAEAGKALHLDVGVGGRSIVGRITFQGDPADARDWKVQRDHSYAARLIKLQPTTGPLVPQPPAGLATEQLAAFYRNWEQSEQGRAARRAQLSDDFPVNPDGTFRFDGAMPGEYVLEVSTFDIRPDQLVAEVVSTGHTRVTVPATPNGQPGQPVDVGTLMIRPVARVKIGQSLPSMDATFLDGASFDLARYKGKPVVLHFWNIPFLQQDNLERIRKWAANDRVVVIGVDPFDDPLRAAAEAKSRRMDWLQIRVPPTWPSNGNPMRPGETILIDSAGVVVARHSFGETKDAVAETITSMGISQ